MRLQEVSKRFDDVVVLDGVNLEFPQTGMVALCGPSGVGKSTLLHLIAGFEQPDAGQILEAPERLAIMFEDDRLLPWMDVLANVRLGGCDAAAALSMLEELGIRDKAHEPLSNLSGGQLRRVALARTLLFPADALLLDEPTIRLDEESTQLVFECIQRHWGDKLVVVSTHDKAFAQRCDRIIELPLSS